MDTSKGSIYYNLRMNGFSDEAATKQATIDSESLFLNEEQEESFTNFVNYGIVDNNED